MSRLLLAIMSHADEKKVLTVLGAGVSIIGVYLGFGLAGVSVEVAGFAVIGLAFVLSRNT